MDNDVDQYFFTITPDRSLSNTRGGTDPKTKQGFQSTKNQGKGVVHILQLRSLCLSINMVLDNTRHFIRILHT